LRVDILNVMGPAIVMSAALWGLRSTARGRVTIFLIATLAAAFLTPIVRMSTIVGVLPDPLEAYLRPIGSMASFSLFPWAGFVFGGALFGVLIDTVRPDASSRGWSSDEARLNLAFLAGGMIVAVGSYVASFVPTPYVRSDFWTSSPAFFFLRLGVLMALIGVSYVWEKFSPARRIWSPFRQLGRTSLFIYWIHVEMVYGVISLPLHHALSLRQSWLALALFSLLMLVCSLGKDRAVAWWETRESRAKNAPPILPSSL
jgi:fucose 4-O-acetylase-like acetyltransferase